MHNLIFYILLLLINSTHAAILVMPEAGNWVGEMQHTHSYAGETLEEVGQRFNIGYVEMLRANPRIQANSVLLANTKLVIPSRFKLPKAPRQGIVVVLSQYRLYYFPPNENIVVTFPVGIGKKGWETPKGVTKVVAKVINPVWRPTMKLQAAAEEKGVLLPDEFPSGSANPLGKYALRLGWPTILIHGTNRPDGIGSKVSAGCIRLLPEDIEYLFNLVPVGTSVRVV